MDRKQIIQAFDKLVPNPKCELEYETPYQLLVAVILSAQCTDKRVNIVTHELFKKFPTPKHMINLTYEELGKLIFSCGFYNSKAKAIIDMSQDILHKFDGKIPQDLDKLISLRGVGRKTANVIISEAFKGDAFAVDTHVLRIASRLGLTESKNPDQVEEDLKKFFPKDSWSKLHYQIVLFGRYKCKAVKPDCTSCPFQSICKYFQGKRANNN